MLRTAKPTEERRRPTSEMKDPPGDFAALVGLFLFAGAFILLSKLSGISPICILFFTLDYVLTNIKFLV